MLYFQIIDKSNVAQLLQDKENVSNGMGSDAFLEIIYIASMCFFIASIVMTVYMIYRRKRELKNEETTQILVEKYQTFLSSFLIIPLDDAFLGITKTNHMEGRLDLADITDPYKRQLLTHEIYNCKKHLIGQQETQLTNYFFGLSLDSDIIQQLSDRRWDKKVWCMKIVAAFKITEALPIINKMINDKNRELAIHAISVRISIDKNVSVLSELLYELNDWEKHKIQYLTSVEKIECNLDIDTPDLQLEYAFQN